MSAFVVRAQMITLPTSTVDQQPYLLDEQGVPYLTEMDSYFYLRKAAEMAEQEQLQFMMDRAEDPLMGSLAGSEEENRRLPLGLSALAYLLWKYLLSPFEVSLTWTAIWMGPVLGSFAAVPAFWYGKKRSSLAGGIATGLLTGCAIPFVIHTHAGFFDTDMLLAVLPLTALLCMIESMRETSLNLQIRYAVISALTFAGIALSWNVYYAYYLLAVLGVFLTLLISLLLPISWRRRRIIARGGLIALGSSLLLFLLIWGKDALLQMLGAVQAYTSVTTSQDQLPYVFTFTEEMQPLRMFPKGTLLNWFKADLDSALGRIGGVLPLVLAILPVPLAMVQMIHRKHTTAISEVDLEEGNEPFEPVSLLPELCILLPWAAAGIYLTLKGKRFAEIAALPVAMLAGLTLGRLCILIHRQSGRKKGLLTATFVALLLATLAPALYGSWKAPQGNHSFITDSLNEAMTWVRENTPEDTAIAAWWDDGYYMEYQARRRTLADGGSDSAKMDWLMAKALLSTNADLSRGIFRMLNESGTAALDELMTEGLSVSEASTLLFDILPLSREEAVVLLTARDLPLSILDRTHPLSPAPLTLVLTSDQPDKYPSLTYYGFWDPEIQAQGQGGYIMPPVRSCELENGYGEIPVKGAYGFTILLREEPDGALQAVYRYEETEIEPGRVEIWEDGRLIFLADYENEHPSILLVKEGNRYSGMICTQNLADSLLVRALFCEDKSLNGFQRLGTWYGNPSSDPAEAHRRVNASEITSWAVQVWQVEP